MGKVCPPKNQDFLHNNPKTETFLLAGEGERAFNSKGLNMYNGLKQGVGTLFFVIMIFYAGFRGHRVVTQLPATYRTTQPPKNMPIKFLSTVFPNKVPSATFEFPAFTICPPDPRTGVSITFSSCFSSNHVAAAEKLACAEGYPRILPFEGQNLNCITLNDPQDLKAVAVADSTDHVLELRVMVAGISPGSPEGVLVAAHPQLGRTEPLTSLTFENFFAASAFTSTQIVGRKLYTIGLDKSVNVGYEIKASSMRLKMDAINNATSVPAPINIEFRFPKLEATYEKAFLVLDMNNWLGEVGGVACLLMLLHRAFLSIVAFGLKQSDNLAYTDLGKIREEGFAHY
ncbi:hypothetical protein DFS34DRAFT_163828 [Phlyctochytrium arcticum]|nr:hypothetical protein DFS34DRAFT_163828 [Phlyctochytrium arcticum]